MEEIKTRAQAKREARDANIIKEWNDIPLITPGCETIVMEKIAESNDCSLSTVRRVLKPKEAK